MIASFAIVAVIVTLDRALGLKITEPNDTEITYTAGATFTLTCEDDQPIKWSYPTYDNGALSKSFESIITENGTFVSRITVYDAIYLDTGYFNCMRNVSFADLAVVNAVAVNESDQFFASVYVFVCDKEHLLAVNESVTVLQPNEFGDLVIPCKPTCPDVDVTLENVESEKIDSLIYDSKIGFTKKSAKVADSGIRTCNAEENTKTDSKIFQVVVNPHDTPKKPIIDTSGAYYPVEGTNVVLNCSITMNAGSIIFIKWIVPDKRIEDKIIDSSQQIISITDKEKKVMETHYKILTIMNVTKYDQGNYVCRVENNYHHRENGSHYLTVYDPDETFLNMSLQGAINEFTLKLGDTEVQWIINITAYPRPTVHCFSPDGRNITNGPTSNSKYLLQFDGRLAKLMIKRVDINDSGTYTITASNIHHKKEISITLHVEDEPRAEIRGKNDVYRLGNNYEIVCVMSAYPLPRSAWFSKKCNQYPTCESEFFEPLPTSDYSEILHSYLVRSTLKFTAHESKIILCNATNKFGSSVVSAPVLVSDVASSDDIFAVTVSHIEITTGDTILLTCQALKYNYTDELTWFFYSPQSNSSIPTKRIEGSSITRVNSTFSYKAILKIENIQKYSSGTYSCRVRTHKNETASRDISVNVRSVEHPTFFYKNMNNSEWKINIGSSLNMRCEVKGVPKPNVTWYKNGSPLYLIPNNSHISLRNGWQTLQIEVAAPNDDGIYTCVASNKGGNISASNTVILVDKQQEHEHTFFIALASILAVFCSGICIILLFRIQKDKRLKKKLAEDGLLHFENGAVDSLNPEIGVEEQADLLPYDKRWEFPREKLKFGKQLGSGAFGVVIKAEADGIIDQNTTTTVAVKLVKKDVDPMYIRALASELKIMIHLGHHLNVVNLLGACTKNITKRELLVIVEFCKYGNLRDFLLKQRNNFVNQVNEHTGELDFSIADVSRNSKYSEVSSNAVDSAATESTLIGSDGYLINKDGEPDWRSNYRGDYRNTIVRPIKTCDLICWSFQIARGMEYLASRKVLHGDLAARNVLLADDNIVKICDFGLAKSMYNNDNYKRTKHDLLPIKWMAVESIRDRVFSIQSDVWSFGITMWELFSLSVVPYPGVEHFDILYSKLESGYRLEKPRYATKEIYDVMLDCWHARPNLRPTFIELSEKLGELLESGIKSHYINLNEMYIRMNSNSNNSVDYLSLLNPPVYTAAEEPRYINIPSRESPEPEENVELKPMLCATDNHYINATPILFMNPNYVEFNKTKRPIMAR